MRPLLVLTIATLTAWCGSWLALPLFVATFALTVLDTHADQLRTNR